MLRRLCLAAIGLAWGAAAVAHDTWFEATAGPRAGQIEMKLGTGDRFPKHEFTVYTGNIDRAACRHRQARIDGTDSADAAERQIELLGAREVALAMRVRAADGARRGQSAAITCWAQLEPISIEIELPKVQVYLDEIRAGADLRRAWEQMHARGLPWRERYVKSARLEWRDVRLGGGDAQPARPAPLAMDIVLDALPERLRAQDLLRFIVLRDGRPLPRQAIELRSDKSPIGLWLQTDEQGRAQVRVPFAGRWLLRGTDLRLSPTRPDEWDSWFVTLAFEVVPG